MLYYMTLVHWGYTALTIWVENSRWRKGHVSDTVSVSVITGHGLHDTIIIWALLCVLRFDCWLLGSRFLKFRCFVYKLFPRWPPGDTLMVLRWDECRASDTRIGHWNIWGHSEILLTAGFMNPAVRLLTAGITDIGHGAVITFSQTWGLRGLCLLNQLGWSLEQIRCQGPEFVGLSKLAPP